MDWKQLGSDFKQKYEQCFCFVTLEGYKIPELFFLHMVEVNSKESPFLHLENERVGTIILKYDDSKSDIDFSFPKIGLIAFKGKVLMVRRKFERQWKNGVHNQTVTAKDIYSKLDSAELIPRGPNLTYEVVTKMFADRPTLSIKQGILALKKDVAVPLSNEFAMGLPITDSEDFILFYYENPIGTINPSLEKVVLKETQFQQEFNDFKQFRGLGSYEIY